MNRARTSLANASKSESGLVTVLQRTDGITAEQKRLGRLVSDRLTSMPLGGFVEMKEKLTGKFVKEPVRLAVLSRETAKMITEGIIKTKLHVAVCSGVNATDMAQMRCSLGALTGLRSKSSTTRSPRWSASRTPPRTARRLWRGWRPSWRRLRLMNLL